VVQHLGVSTRDEILQGRLPWRTEFEGKLFHAAGRVARLSRPRGSGASSERRGSIYGKILAGLRRTEG
jgi:hypothetical protein